MVGFITTLIIALVVSMAAATVAKDKILNGVWGAIPVGVLGAWIGGYSPLFKDIGPVYDGVAVLPSIVGSALLIAVIGLFRNVISEMVS